MPIETTLPQHTDKSDPSGTGSHVPAWEPKAKGQRLGGLEATPAAPERPLPPTGPVPEGSPGAEGCRGGSASPRPGGLLS